MKSTKTNRIKQDMDNYCFYLRRHFVDVENLTRKLVFDYIFCFE